MSTEQDLTAQYFLSACSHELRTPLNGIIGYNQLLSQTKLDSTQKTYLNSMNQCCTQLLQLINDILDFSKLASGKMKLHNECFMINEIIDEVNSIIGFVMKEKRQTYSFVLDKNLPEYIVADKGKITQILINLLSNASKYTQIEGRMIVHVSCDKSESKLYFSVEDNGIGISMKDQEKLFDAFYQVKETKSGSGLGLAICKKLTELMGGEISVESEKGFGTIFTFSIHFEQFETFQKQVSANVKILQGKYVLVVDDNIDNRLIISNMLFECGVSPIICSSGKEAIQIIEKQHYPFCVALLDICMPDMSGSDVAKKLREIDNDLKIIALSSVDEISDKSNFISVLSKPINKVKLLDTIVKILNVDSISECILQEDSEIQVQEDIGKDSRILLAEDISYNLDMTIKMLNTLGYKNITTALDGKETIEKIEMSQSKNCPYDILLLDLKMPILDGFSVIEYIREKGYKYPQIAVLTASIIDDDKQRCKNLDVKYFILKPVNMRHLKIILKRLVSETIHFM